MFNKVAIIGVGLIGGSIGLAVKKKRLAKEVIGIGRRKSSLERALKKGAIEEAVLDLDLGVACADLVILATPISVMPAIARQIKNSLRPGSIIIDVGSTKSDLASEMKKILPKTVHYVGCHPMAGSEKRGVDFADESLFKNSICIITSSHQADAEAIAKIKKLWIKLGAKIIVLRADLHDRLIGEISHLAHLAATALVASVSDEALRYASGGFRDTTRIASSDSLVWRDICMTNRKAIVAALDKYITVLTNIKTKIRSGRAQQLEKFFRQAKDKRDKLFYRS